MCTRVKFRPIKEDRIVYAVRQYFDGQFQSPWFGEFTHGWKLNEKEVATPYSLFNRIRDTLRCVFSKNLFIDVGRGYFHTFQKLEDAKEYLRILSEDVNTFGYDTEFVICKFRASGRKYTGWIKVAEWVDHEQVIHSLQCIVSRELTMLEVLNET